MAEAQILVDMRGGLARSVAAAFAELRDEGVEPDTNLCNRLILACSKAEKPAKALAVFDWMLERGEVKPDQHTYSAALVACTSGERGHADKAWDVFQLACRDENARQKPVVYKAAITALARDGKLEQMQEAFERMLAAGLQPDPAVCKLMLTVLEKGGKTQEMMTLFDRMRADKNNRPDRASCRAAIEACAKDGNVEKAHEIFTSMREEGPRPDAATCDRMISIFEAAGRYDEARGVRQMARLHRDVHLHDLGHEEGRRGAQASRTARAA
jgi:pentatricopeptide repeat protein